MIYLIDDNQFSQREKFLPNTSWDDYSIKMLTKIPKTGDMSYIDHLKFLVNADCILLHKSMDDVDQFGNYIKGSTTNSNKIVNDIAKYGDEVPLVVFTGGTLSNIKFDPKNPNLLEELQKSKFYNRLIPFLENYKKTGQVDLSIFVYGQNFELEKLNLIADKILAGLRYSDDHQIVDLDDLPQDAFKEFIGRANVKYDFKEVIQNWSKKPITVKQFKNRIIQLLKESDG